VLVQTRCWFRPVVGSDPCWFRPVVGSDPLLVQTRCGSDPCWFRPVVGSDPLLVQTRCGSDPCWFRPVLVQTRCGSWFRPVVVVVQIFIVKIPCLSQLYKVEPPQGRTRCLASLPRSRMSRSGPSTPTLGTWHPFESCPLQPPPRPLVRRNKPEPCSGEQEPCTTRSNYIISAERVTQRVVRGSLSEGSLRRGLRHKRTRSY
jgi:hypothetical protein